MLLNQWKEHASDGLVYKLIVVHERQRLPAVNPSDPPQYVPRILCLLCNAEYEAPKKALKPHPLDRMYVNEEYDVEVCDSAFNDFDHLCVFAKEVATLLECEPATIIRAI